MYKLSYDEIVKKIYIGYVAKKNGQKVTFKSLPIRSVGVVDCVFDYDGLKTISLKYYYENEMFDDDGDLFATVGKSIEKKINVAINDLKRSSVSIKKVSENIISDKNDYAEESLSILKMAYGSNASFREGQLEAILSTFNHKRTLIVQKTGWGKSLVYFIITKINRNHGRGVTLIISPLLVLIDNQIDAAKRFGLRCEKIASSNKDDYLSVIDSLKNNQIDILFITPESLFSKLLPFINDISIGMFVIDEVHCISDWGHDFRLDYRKIVDVINTLKDTSFPILATTATADNRVISDLESQIGPNLYISRGSLFRSNLYIQLVDLKNKTNKYAWILQHINELPGVGIIYCLTTRDCETLSKFLEANHIKAKPYHSKLNDDVANENLKLFINNEIKVLVATIKLGMGYDKGDVSFIIHYQFPKNIISYYQQIGRAARNIDKGYVILLRGGNDYKILNSYIDSSFPEEDDMIKVLDCFNKLPWGKTYLTDTSARKLINISGSRINKALRFLEFDGVVSRDKKKYSKTPKQFIYNGDHYREIINYKRRESNALNELFEYKGCINKFLINYLDDNSPIDCKNCCNCLNKDIIDCSVNEYYYKIADSFITNDYIVIYPKHNCDLKVQDYGGWTVVNSMKNGIALSKYGEDGIGSIIGECKYSNPPKEYPEAIYTKATKLLFPIIKEYGITHIAFVPSLNNNLMEIFANKLGYKLGLKVLNIFKKNSNILQKTMYNNEYQKKNAEDNYSIKNDVVLNGISIIIIDDIVDSGYTLSCLGNKLMKAGAKNVVPFALADSSTRGGDNDE